MNCHFKGEAQSAESVKIDVNDLAQEIRRVDGNNALGAGALAEVLMPFLKSALQSQDREDALRYRWLCDKFGITKLPCAIERIIAGDVYVADGKAGIDEAIDHARRAEGGGE